MWVHSRWLCVGFLSLALLGCGDTEGNDAGSRDAGVSSDSGPRDAAARDDAGTTDAGTTDAGTSDSGLLDATVADAGTTDAGPADAGGDSGSADGGPTDAGTDAGACSYLDLELWIGDCGGGYAYIRRWTDSDGVCPAYFTVGSTRFETLEDALTTSSCDAACLRGPSTSVSLLRCGVRTGYIVYRDEGGDCPELLETPDGLFESGGDWDEAFPCPE